MELLESIGLEPKLLLMQALSFIVLYLVLRKFLFAPIGSMIDARNKEVAERLDRAARDERAMEAVRTEYERRISEIETEARDRIQTAMAEARRLADEVKDNARADAEELKNRALAQIDREREKALKEIQDHIVDLSIDAAGRVVGQSLDTDAHRRLVRGFIDELGTETSTGGAA